jgi:hypothetical protein
LSWWIVHGKRHGSTFSFLHADTQFFQQHVEEAVFSPFYVFGAFVKNHVSVAAWIRIWVFYFCSAGLRVCFCASTML